MSKVVSSITANGEVYSIQYYVIKVVSDLQQVGGFLRVFRFPPPIKLPTSSGLARLSAWPMASGPP